MRSVKGWLPVLVILTVAAAAVAGEVTSEKGFVPLCNGKDLTGWDGNPDFWSVKDGIIRGQTTKEKPTKGNTFLIWRAGKLEDFELRVSFRIQSGNSGVQYRSQDRGKWVVSGYQAEVCNQGGKAGFLYHEKGRKSLARVGQKVVIDETGKPNVVGSLGDAKKVAATFKSGDWNHYRIIARGNHLVHYLNDVQTIDLVDNDEKGRAMSGILALQIHAGKPMLVEFKAIRLKRFGKGETPATK